MQYGLPLVATVLLAASSVCAQGTYQLYGSSCASGECGSANGTATVPSGARHNVNTFALRVPPSATTRVVLGFELLTSATSSISISTEILGANALGAPTGAPIATGTMAIGTADAWYKTSLAAPLIIPANDVVFLSYTPDSTMKFPFVAVGDKVSHFWHPPAATNWNGAPPLGFQTVRWAWRLNCAGGMPPQLTATGVPSLNSTMTVNLTDARPNATALFAFGVSDTNWGALNLPFDLSLLNAPGCSIYASAEFLFFQTTTPMGTQEFKLTIPNDPTLSGFNFYNQYVVDDPSANGFGAAFTNGGKATIG